MRAIRFRAWDKVTKRYYAVSGLEFDENGELCEVSLAGIEIDESNPTANVRKPSDVVLEQYTGLKDKNGKEICEGDIVKTCSIGTWAVEGRRGCFFVGKYALYGYNDYGEVIGNIHENPELLEHKG